MKSPQHKSVFTGNSEQVLSKSSNKIIFNPEQLIAISMAKSDKNPFLHSLLVSGEWANNQIYIYGQWLSAWIGKWKTKYFSTQQMVTSKKSCFHYWESIHHTHKSESFKPFCASAFLHLCRNNQFNAHGVCLGAQILYEKLSTTLSFNFAKISNSNNVYKVSIGAQNIERKQLSTKCWSFEFVYRNDNIEPISSQNHLKDQTWHKSFPV